MLIKDKGRIQRDWYNPKAFLFDQRSEHVGKVPL